MSRDRDRTVLYWPGIAVTNAVPVQGQRLDLDGTHGVSIHTVTLGGAAGSLAVYQTNFDNSMQIPPFDADTPAYMFNAPGTPIALTANSSSLTSVGSGGQLPFSRWLILRFTPSASGTLWLSISLRRLTA